MGRQGVIEDDANPFEVDTNRLDWEWGRQARLYYRYAVIEAEARRSHAEAKTAMDVCAATLKLAIRAEPSRGGFTGRPTVDDLASAVEKHADYIQALQGVTDAKYALDIAAAAVRALDHKKTTLENYTVLWSRNYYAAPRLPEEHLGPAKEKAQQMVDGRDWANVGIPEDER